MVRSQAVRQPRHMDIDHDHDRGADDGDADSRGAALQARHRNLDHRHTAACWWDHEQAAWDCTSGTCAASASSDRSDRADRPAVDVRDMLVVHTALLREFRLAPQAVARVPAGGRGQARRVGRHLDLLCDLLHHHHRGEDELLWPVLRDRLSPNAVAQLDQAQAQHTHIDAALRRVGAARHSWLEQVDAASRDVLVAALQSLHRLLAEHLDDEERTLLPLAAAHLTPTQWHAIGAAGAAGVPKSRLPLVFGMFAYEGDPDVLAGMLQAAPALPRLLVPLLAPRVYARRAARVHGTPRP